MNKSALILFVVLGLSLVFAQQRNGNTRNSGNNGNNRNNNNGNNRSNNNGKNAVWPNEVPEFRREKKIDYVIESASNSGKCKVQTCTNGRSQQNFWVTYADGPRIQVCVCPNAFTNVTTIAEKEAQVPIHLRSSVTSITIATKRPQAGVRADTITNLGDITLFGDYSVNSYIGDAARAVDYAQGNGVGTQGLSGTDEWTRAWTNGQCVATNDAKVGAFEAFSETAIVRYWAKANNRDFNSGGETNCMKEQLQYTFKTFPNNLPNYERAANRGYYVSPVSDRNIVITTTNANTRENSPLSVTQNQKMRNQAWKIIPTAFDYVLVCESNSYNCLSNNNDQRVGRQAVVAARNGFFAQQHKIVGLGNNQYKIVNRHSNLALGYNCPVKANGNSNAPAYWVKDDNNDCTKFTHVVDNIPVNNTNNNNEWCKNTVGNRLSSNNNNAPSQLKASSNRFLSSPNCEYKLVDQMDGNIVLYDRSSRALWQSGKLNSGDNALVMQNDGNLVQYNSMNQAIWQTNTGGKGTGPYNLILENNGALSVRDSNNQLIWKGR